MLAIQPKHHQRNLVSYLTESELGALLAACDASTWTGRRDHAMFLLAAQSGLRVSELIGLDNADLVLEEAPRALRGPTCGRRSGPWPLSAHAARSRAVTTHPTSSSRSWRRSDEPWVMPTISRLSPPPSRVSQKMSA